MRFSIADNTEQTLGNASKKTLSKVPKKEPTAAKNQTACRPVKTPQGSQK